MENRNECFSDFSKQKTAKERLSHMGEREEYLKTQRKQRKQLHA